MMQYSTYKNSLTELGHSRKKSRPLLDGFLKILGGGIQGYGNLGKSGVEP